VITSGVNSRISRPGQVLSLGASVAVFGLWFLRTGVWDIDGQWVDNESWA
jgi:hypothetical protein